MNHSISTIFRIFFFYIDDLSSGQFRDLENNLSITSQWGNIQIYVFTTKRSVVIQLFQNAGILGYIGYLYIL